MSNTLREEWAEVCAERDKLRAEVGRLRTELAKCAAGEAHFLDPMEATVCDGCGEVASPDDELLCSDCREEK